MAIQSKICGINSREALDAAARGGAAFVGFVFYPPSPRALSPEAARTLASATADGVIRTGLFVDANDDTLTSTLATVPLDLLQLHGNESPARVAAIKARFGKPVMKVLKVAEARDLDEASAYLEIADRLLFDAKAPRSLAGALPGGNAVSFDWTLLSGRSWSRPWMLSGGLTAENLAEAVKTSGARAVDVSSGVEAAPGKKDPARIRAFLEAARGL